MLDQGGENRDEMSKLGPAISTKDIPIFRSSLTVMLALGMGAVSEIFKDVTIAWVYGATSATDAFFLASGVLVILATVILSTANRSLVPVFSEIRHTKGEKVTFSLASNVSAFLVQIGIVFVVLGMISAPAVTRLLGPGFSAWQFDLAVAMFRILLPLVVFAGITSVNVALLNARGRFWRSSSIGLVRNSVIIAFILFLSDSFHIWTLPVAFLVGYFVVTIVTLFPLVRKGYRLRMSVDWADDHLGATFGLMWLPFLSLLLRQNGATVERMLASFLVSGSISALNYAAKIVLGLSTILGTGIFTASLPNLSTWMSNRDVNRVRHTIRSELLWVFVFVVPLTGVLVLFAPLVVRLVYQHGAFGASSADLTADVLAVYALGTPFFASLPLLQSIFYASKDVRTPAIHMILMLSINIAMDILFMRIWGVRGLALAGSATGVISFSRLLWIADRRIDSLIDKRAIVSMLKIISVGALFAGFGSLVKAWSEWSSLSLLHQIGRVLFVIAVGGGLYAIAIVVMVRPSTHKA